MCLCKDTPHVYKTHKTHSFLTIDVGIPTGSLSFVDGSSAPVTKVYAVGLTVTDTIHTDRSSCTSAVIGEFCIFVFYFLFFGFFWLF